MREWHQESDGRWFCLDGEGHSAVEIYEAELNDWPPIVELRATIAKQREIINHNLGAAEWWYECWKANDATIAALLAGTTNCARNLRNLGEAHADGDDPIIDGIILDSGVIPEASMSSLFIAAADALDDLAAVVEEEQ